MKETKTNTVVIFYGVTPSQLFHLFEDMEIDNPCIRNPAIEEFRELSYGMDTEKKFLKTITKNKHE